MHQWLIKFLLITSIGSACLQAIEVSSSSNSSKLNSDNLSSLTFDQIHRLAVEAQINQARAQKSIETRARVSLNGVYDFCLDEFESGFKHKWHSNDLQQLCNNKSNFYRMPVPAAFNELTSQVRVRDFMGWVWYQRIIEPTVAVGSLGKIHFENANYLALVWIQELNSSTGLPVVETGEARFVGSHVGGHLPFTLDAPELVLVTKKMSFANEATEGRLLRLTVALSNQLTNETIPSGQQIDLSSKNGRKFSQFKPDFDFFHFAGLMGDIWAIGLPPIHWTSVDRLGPLWSSDGSMTFRVCVRSIRPSTVLMLQLELRSKGRTLYRHPGRILELSRAESDECMEMVTRGHQGPLPKWQLAEGDVNHVASLIEARFTLSEQQTTRRWMEVHQMVSLWKHDATAAATHSERPEHSTELKLIDVFSLRTGWRSEVRLHRERGLLVSGGRRQQLQGFGMHHEQLFGGRHMDGASVAKDLYLLKQLGVNLIRTSHYPYSASYLDGCDEAGILVIAECPAVGLNSFSDQKLQLHKIILAEMIYRDNHRPSVIAWSVANEPQSQLYVAARYFRSLINWTRNDELHSLVGWSNERPLTAAIAQSSHSDYLSGMLDLVMLNRYLGWYERPGDLEAIDEPLRGWLIGWGQRLEGIPLLVSEFGAESLVGVNSWQGDQIYSEEYQAELIERHERVFDELWSGEQPEVELNSKLRNSFVSSGGQVCRCNGIDEANNNRSLLNDPPEINFWGSMVWNFADFQTHNGQLQRIGALNRKGVFTRAREPKLAAHRLSSIYLSRLRGRHN